MPKKLPTDVNQRAKSIVDLVTSHEPMDKPEPPQEKNPAAVALGRLGGLKGGRARAAKLTAEERTASAKKAAERRWSK